MFRAILCALAVVAGVGALISHPTSAEIVPLSGPAAVVQAR
jgi:hypothetical protein